MPHFRFCKRRHNLFRRGRFEETGDRQDQLRQTTLRMVLLQGFELGKARFNDL